MGVVVHEEVLNEGVEEGGGVLVGFGLGFGLDGGKVSCVGVEP